MTCVNPRLGRVHTNQPTSARTHARTHREAQRDNPGGADEGEEEVHGLLLRPPQVAQARAPPQAGVGEGGDEQVQAVVRPEVEQVLLDGAWAVNG